MKKAMVSLVVSLSLAAAGEAPGGLTIEGEGLDSPIQLELRRGPEPELVVNGQVQRLIPPVPENPTAARLLELMKELVLDRLREVPAVENWSEPVEIEVRLPQSQRGWNLKLTPTP